MLWRNNGIAIKNTIESPTRAMFKAVANLT